MTSINSYNSTSYVQYQQKSTYYNYLDQDSNKSIDTDELEVMAEKLSELTGQEVSSSDLMSQIDQDGDSELTEAELQAHMESILGEPQDHPAMMMEGISKREQLIGAESTSTVSNIDNLLESYSESDEDKDGVSSEMMRPAGPPPGGPPPGGPPPGESSESTSTVSSIEEILEALSEDDEDEDEDSDEIMKPAGPPSGPPPGGNAVSESSDSESTSAVALDELLESLSESAEESDSESLLDYLYESEDEEAQNALSGIYQAMIQDGMATYLGIQSNS